MSDKDLVNLRLMLDAVQRIRRFSGAFQTAERWYNDDMAFDAVLLNFINLGEAANRLSKEHKLENSHIPWKAIKGFRNIVAHNYFGVDAEDVWQIIQEDLPALEVDIKRLIEA